MRACADLPSSSPRSFWVAGFHGAIYRRNGGAWIAEGVPGRPHLEAITGAGGHVWAVGADGAILSKGP